MAPCCERDTALDHTNRTSAVYASPRRHRTNEAPSRPAAAAVITQTQASDAPLELVAQLRAVRDSPLLDSFNSNDAFADVPAPELGRAASLGDDITRGFHGTTTVAFQYKKERSAASTAARRWGRSWARRRKNHPHLKRVLGTMAGSAADCVSWLRLLSALSKLHELEYARRVRQEPRGRHAGLCRAARGRRVYEAGLPGVDAARRVFVSGAGDDQGARSSPSGAERRARLAAGASAKIGP